MTDKQKKTVAEKYYTGMVNSASEKPKPMIKTVNCENCQNFRWPLMNERANCNLGKRIMFRTTYLPGFKQDPGYRRKCAEFKQK